MKLYISHGAGGDWFIVEPRDNPDQAVVTLLRHGRRVYELPVVLPHRPFNDGRLIELSDLTT